MNRPAILTGGLLGLAVIVPLVAVQLVVGAVTDDVPDALVAVLFVGIVAAFGLAGFVAGRREPGAPAKHGAVAALLALAAWIPLRLVIAAVGDGDNALEGIGGAVAFALLMGAVGGLWSARRARSV